MPSRIVTPPRRQHLVSRVVLKRFTVASKMTVLDRQADAIYSKGPGGLFHANLDRHAPWAAEERWNSVETNMPAVYKLLDRREAHSSLEALQTLRDLIAVHWVRNWSLRETLTAIQGQVLAAAIERRRLDSELLAVGYRQMMGLEPAGEETLEWFNHRVHVESMERGREEFLSESFARLFDRAREMMRHRGVEICYSGTDDLVIGDTPVVTTKVGHQGVGPHQGVALGDASAIWMPIDPHILVSLGPNSRLAMMDDTAVAQFNSLQRRGYHRWLGCLPGGPADQHLRATTTPRSTQP